MKINSNSLGLVLSGGGTKGLAHAGVLKFLEEKGLRPQQIAGTSAGAIVAALYAGGKSPEEILDFFKSIYFFNWKHFTFKKAGLIDSDVFKMYFDSFFKEKTIGDMNIKIHIAATDIVKGKLKIFGNETKIVDAVLASSSFPGVLSPYKVDNNLYSDGGILNHFPTDVLQGHCENIIGVYVSPLQKVDEKDLNTIKAVTTRAFELLSANSNQNKFNFCDWVIVPEELSSYGTFETNKQKMDKIFEIGYNSAKESYNELK